jgi:hypothetical protein
VALSSIVDGIWFDEKFKLYGNRRDGVYMAYLAMTTENPKEPLLWHGKMCTYYEKRCFNLLV